MTKMTQLKAHELDLIVGGVYPTTTTDPNTGETVVRDCTGGEIGRYPAGGMHIISF